MNVVNALLGIKDRRSNLRDDDGWLYDWASGGRTSASGERVTPKAALSLSAYFACIRAISEDVAKLPSPVYERIDPRGKKRRLDHPLHKLLRRPNPHMTRMTFFETLGQHALAWGNGYAELVRDRGGRVRKMWPIDPTRVRLEIMPDRSLIYHIRRASHTEEVRLSDHDVLHVPGFGFDGYLGYTVPTLARESIGLSLGMERSGAGFFGNASRPSGVLETPQALDGPGRQNLRSSWERMYKGTENAHRTAVLEEGVTFKPLSIPFEDAQWIEARQFAVEEMCRWTRMPPHKIAHLLRATGWSTLEATNTDYVVDTLMPWFRRWEEEIHRKLLLEGEQDVLFVEFLAEGLLRGDIKTRYEAHATSRMWGWASANDVLELENQNPIGEQGDIYLTPMNMMPADQAGQMQEEPKPDVEAGVRLLLAEQANQVYRESTSKAPVDIIDKMVAVYVPSLTQGMRHLLEVEGKRLKKLNGTTDLAEWADDFYESHLGKVERTLAVTAEQFCNMIWTMLGDGPLSPAVLLAGTEHTKAMAQRHIERSKQHLDELRAGKPEWCVEDEARKELRELADLMKRHCGQ